VTCHGTGSHSMMFQLVSGKSTDLPLMFGSSLVVGDAFRSFDPCREQQTLSSAIRNWMC